MVKVYSIDGLTPVVHPDAYVHPSAVLIGDVHVGAGVYIGPSASLRETVALTKEEPGRRRLSLAEVLPLSEWKNKKIGG